MQEFSPDADHYYWRHSVLVAIYIMHMHAVP